MRIAVFSASSEGMCGRLKAPVADQHGDEYHLYPEESLSEIGGAKRRLVGEPTSREERLCENERQDRKGGQRIFGRQGRKKKRDKGAGVDA
jgi:hypothetical protein